MVKRDGIIFFIDKYFNKLLFQIKKTVKFLINNHY
jgi:hypothetical protein